MASALSSSGAMIRRGSSGVFAAKSDNMSPDDPPLSPEIPTALPFLNFDIVLWIKSFVCIHDIYSDWRSAGKRQVIFLGIYETFSAIGRTFSARG